MTMEFATIGGVMDETRKRFTRAKSLLQLREQAGLFGAVTTGTDTDETYTSECRRLQAIIDTRNAKVFGEIRREIQQTDAADRGPHNARWVVGVRRLKAAQDSLQSGDRRLALRRLTEALSTPAITLDALLPIRADINAYKITDATNKIGRLCA